MARYPSPKTEIQTKWMDPNKRDWKEIMTDHYGQWLEMLYYVIHVAIETTQANNSKRFMLNDKSVWLVLY